jgi:hypothetical protein
MDEAGDSQDAGRPERQHGDDRTHAVADHEIFLCIELDELSSG